MADTMWGIMNIVGPLLILVVLLWLVLRTRSKRDSGENGRAEEGTREFSAKKEARRREGTDGL